MGGDADFYHGLPATKTTCLSGSKSCCQSPDAMLRMIRNDVTAVTKCHPPKVQGESLKGTLGFVSHEVIPKNLPQISQHTWGLE